MRGSGSQERDMFPGAGGPSEGIVKDKRDGGGGSGGGSDRERTVRQRHSLWTQKTKVREMQCCALFPRRQDNLNSNAPGKRLTEADTDPPKKLEIEVKD